MTKAVLDDVVGDRKNRVGAIIKDDFPMNK
jgi:hypothetical protein